MSVRCKLRSGYVETPERSLKSLSLPQVPRGAISAVVLNAELGKVTMGRKIPPLPASIVHGRRLCHESWRTMLQFKKQSLL